MRAVVRNSLVASLVICLVLYLGIQRPTVVTTGDSTFRDLESLNPSHIPVTHTDPSVILNDAVEPWQNTTRAKAAIVILVRNNEIDDIRYTLRQFENRFNRKFNYPYVFLNDVEFTDEFKELTTTMTKAETKYGVIPKEHWSYPGWIDVAKADQLREQMGANGVIYGSSLPYRHMCRFNSGFFYHHPLLQEYDYYWRVEPTVDFYCDLDYDPFLFMQQNGKRYGFTITLYEFEQTIPTLWETTKAFMREHPDLMPENNLMDFLSNDKGNTYNLCHFWSNFEIADLRLWRSEAYQSYFDYLDKAGGFFYERWGDAPVHSIGAALFLQKDEVHFFNDIGYRHNPYIHCPQDKSLLKKCHCDPADNFGKYRRGLACMKG